MCFCSLSCWLSADNTFLTAAPTAVCRTERPPLYWERQQSSYRPHMCACVFCFFKEVCFHATVQRSLKIRFLGVISLSTGYPSAIKVFFFFVMCSERCRVSRLKSPAACCPSREWLWTLWRRMRSPSTLCCMAGSQSVSQSKVKI